MTGCDDCNPVENAECSTDIRVNLLEAWRSSAKDPDEAVHGFLTVGAPAGIRNHAQHCGIFLVTPADAMLDAETLITDYDGFVNYSGVESDADAILEIKNHVAAGHLES